MSICENMPTKLRAKQITSYYPVGLSTVWLYAKQGKLTAIKVSRGVTVFDTKEVIEFFAGQR